MGQKIHPIGFRLAVNRNWGSRWYANKKHYAPMLAEDIKVREFLKKKLAHASVAKVMIERPAKNARITIHSARPGVVIGKKGEDIETLRGELRRMMGSEVRVNIEEIRKPEIDAQLVADSIAQQLEKRIMFRRAMKRAMQNAMRLGAQGIKIMSSGRLNGIEIARREWYREGRVPLHTLRADIDYGFAEAQDDLRRHRHQGLGVQGRGDGAQRGARAGAGARAGNLEASAPHGTGGRGIRRSRSEECCSQLEGNTARSRRAATRASRPSATRSASASTASRPPTRGRLTSRQIEAARRAMTRHIKRGGRIWIRIFPDKPMSKKPAEVRMGNGKGNPEYYVAEIQPGKVLYEMDGVEEALAREAFALAAAKLPLQDDVRASPRRLTENEDETQPNQAHARRQVAGRAATELEALLKEQFGLRMQRATQQLANTAKISDVRRGIARVRTLLAQKNRGQAGATSQAKGRQA